SFVSVKVDADFSPYERAVCLERTVTRNVYVGSNNERRFVYSRGLRRRRQLQIKFTQYQISVHFVLRFALSKPSDRSFQQIFCAWFLSLSKGPVLRGKPPEPAKPCVLCPQRCVSSVLSVAPW